MLKFENISKQLITKTYKLILLEKIMFLSLTYNNNKKKN